MLFGISNQLKKGTRSYVSHLLYADDMQVFLRANSKSVIEMNNLLQTLASYTGLNINKAKSKLLFSKGSKNKEHMISLIGIPEGTLPVKYLGIPLSVT